MPYLQQCCPPPAIGRVCAAEVHLPRVAIDAPALQVHARQQDHPPTRHMEQSRGSAAHYPNVVRVEAVRHDGAVRAPAEVPFRVSTPGAALEHLNAFTALRPARK
jgi:hypothetical protein